MRGWPKDEQRAVFQPVGVSIFAMSAAWLGAKGALSADIVKLFLIGLPALALGTWLGFKLYGHLDDAKWPIVQVGQTASRYSREFVATVISLLTTALGVVAALAWNTALTAVFTEYLGKGARVAALFTYAVVITVIGVIVIIALARIATRIGAEPLEFKYPAPKKD